MDLDALASGNLEGTVYDGHHDAIFEDGIDNGFAASAADQANASLIMSSSFGSTAVSPARANRGISRKPSLDLDLAASGHLEGTAYDGSHGAIFEEELASPSRSVQFAEPEPEPEPEPVFREMPRDRTRQNDTHADGPGTVPKKLASTSSMVSIDFPNSTPARANRGISRKPSLDLDLAASGHLEGTAYDGSHGAIFEEELASPSRSVQFAEPEPVFREMSRDHRPSSPRHDTAPARAKRTISSQPSLDLDLAASGHDGPVSRTHSEDVRKIHVKVSTHSLVLEEDDILADLLDMDVNKFTHEVLRGSERGLSRPQDNDIAVIDRYIALARDQKHDNFLLLAEADRTQNGSWDWPRYMAYKITASKVFEIAILLVITANIITLALYEPTQPADAGRNKVLTNIENGFLLIYWLELILRVVSDGFFAPKNTTRKAYMQQHENWLDCIIVIAGTVEFVLWVSDSGGGGGGGGGGIAALRALRALRVLKFVKSLQSLRLVIKVLIDSIPQIMNVFICLGVRQATSDAPPPPSSFSSSPSPPRLSLSLSPH